MAFAEDFAPFFDPRDFGVAGATFAGNSVNGIFDNPAKDYSLGRVGISDSAPSFMGRTVDLAAALRGTTITINGIGYTVIDNNADGTGATTLELEKS